jgi:hypothetical protein
LTRDAGASTSREQRSEARHDGQRRAGTAACGGQAGGESAPVGKPFQRRTDAGAVDRSHADPADGGGDMTGSVTGLLGNKALLDYSMMKAASMPSPVRPAFTVLSGTP